MTDPLPSDPVLEHQTATAEADLARQFWGRIRLFAVRRLRDAAGAEDVAQETLRRVVDALRSGRIENPAALPAYVFQTARNICLQSHRSAGREARALTRLERDPRPSSETDPLGALITQDRAHALHTALGRLPSEERDFLRMIYFHQEDTEVIAARLGLSPGAVRVRKHRLLRKLGELLGESTA